MTIPSASPDVTARARRWLLPVAVVLVGLVLVQAALAGRALFGSAGFEVHGYLGNASFAVGVVGAIAAVVARADRTIVGLAVLLAVALFAQTGLGYVGRESAEAASWHVPLGVTIFGLAAVQAALLATERRRVAA